MTKLSVAAIIADEIVAHLAVDGHEPAAPFHSLGAK